MRFRAAGIRERTRSARVATSGKRWTFTVRNDAKLPKLRSASLTIGEFLLPAWLSAFRTLKPEIHPQLEVVNSAAVLSAVRDGRTAIGFVEGASTVAELDSLLVARDELVVVVAANHPWARRRVIALSALAGEPYLTRERDSGTRAVATAALAARGITLTPALEAASTQSLKRMIAASGFSILSSFRIFGGHAVRRSLATQPNGPQGIALFDQPCQGSRGGDRWGGAVDLAGARSG
ncbi:MAG: LysR substrate-binding domain-containing protein [Solirubrobacteraceae bacterium]